MPPSASLLSAATKYQRLHDSILLLSSFLSAGQQHSHTPAPPDSRTASPPHPRTSSTVTSAPRPIFEPAPLPRHDATVHQPPAFRCLKVILDQLEKLFKPDANALLREFGFQVLELLDIVQFKTFDTSSKSSQIVSSTLQWEVPECRSQQCKVLAGYILRWNGLDGAQILDWTCGFAVSIAYDIASQRRRSLHQQLDHHPLSALKCHGSLPACK
nr:nuclear pore complex protein NUP205 isoform X2 [Ipomoea batatas]